MKVVIILSFIFSRMISSLRINSHKFTLSTFQTCKLTMSSETILKPVRVRFAPSPTGSLHVGGARTALYNWLLARQTKGQFIIRVEDTDEARSTRESENSILADLKWLKMTWDEGPEVGGPHGPYRQSERKDIYLKYAELLINKGLAYRCFCSEEELEEKRTIAEAEGKAVQYDGTWRDADPVEVQKKLDNGEPYTVRYKVPPGKSCSIDDLVRGRVTWDAEASLGDFIILRSNGMPVYNFCVAVDDATMGITHVIRAEEHLTNTLRQLLVLEGIGFEPPTYAHCSLILGADRSKLSKRHGATSVKQFSEQGFLPDAMVNYLAALGWNEGTDKDIYTPAELTKAFSLDRIIKSPAVFDMDRLKWINGQHIKALPLAELEPLVRGCLQTSESPILPSSAASEDRQAVFVSIASKLCQPYMELVTDARAIVMAALSHPFQDTVNTDPHVSEIMDDDFQSVVQAIIKDFDSGKLPSGSEQNFAELWKAYVKGLGKELGRKGKRLFHPLRLALTGGMSGPDVGEQLQLVSAGTGVVMEGLPIVSISARVEALKSYLAKQNVTA